MADNTTFNTHLYLGFGGSGSKTLAQFAETLARHHELGARSQTHMAFMLIDTFTEDLEKGSDRISKAFMRIGREPIVRTFCLSKDFPTFNTSAGPRLYDALDRDAANRLDDYWWIRRDAQGRRIPFTAARFPHSPADGAGQAPLISTFLAWHWLGAATEGLSDLIDDVVLDLQRRLTASGNSQNLNLRTTVVAGLAGGTGRGCWHLLASKVSQLLSDKGQYNQPIGIFFDATAFPEVMARDPVTKMKMTVNSLTGFSELIGFRRNEIEVSHDQFHMQLPSLTSPHDPRADVLDTTKLLTKQADGTVKPNSGFAPISMAHVIFGSGRSGAPGESFLYYRIAANAMYAEFIADIKGAGANTTKLGGIGCASFAVPVGDVRTFGRLSAQRLAPATLSASISADDVERIVATGWKRLTPGDFDGNEQSKTADTLMKRLCARLVASTAKEVDGIYTKITDNKRDEAKAALAELSKLPNSPGGIQKIKSLVIQELTQSLWGNQTAADVPGQGGLLRDLGVISALGKHEFDEVYPSTPGGNPIALAFAKLVSIDLLPIAGGQATSVDVSGYGTKRDILNRIADKLESGAEEVARLRVADTVTDVAAKTLLLEQVDAATRGIFDWVITDPEASKIKTATETFLKAQSLDTLRDTVATLFKDAAQALRTLASRYQGVIDAIEAVGVEKGVELGQLARDSFWGEDDHDLVVAPGTGQLRFSRNILDETQLKPVLEDAESAIGEAVKRRLAGASEDVRAALAEIRAKVSEWLASSTSNPEKLKTLLRRGLRTLGDRMELGEQFYREHFTLAKVVRQHLLDWNRLFLKYRNADEKQQRIREAFQSLFGAPLPDLIESELDGNEDDVEKTVEEVCLGMAAQIGHRCDVLMTQKTDQPHAIDRAIVVLPADPLFADSFAKKCLESARKTGLFRDGKSLAIISTYDPNGESVANPFSMLGYAAEEFIVGKIGNDEELERVTSLTSQFQNNDPRVLAWLEACEDANGMSVFEDDEKKLTYAGNCFGLGFSFPFFVRNERMRTCRWRPWARDLEKKLRGDEDAKRQANLLVTDAILFALLDEPSDDDTGITKANAGMEPVWKMPLLVMPAAPCPFDAPWAFKRQAFRESRGTISATAPAFNDGDPYPGILALLEVFRKRSNGIVDTIAAEAVIYLKDKLPSCSSMLTPDKVTQRLFEELHERLSTLSRGLQGPADMVDRSSKEMALLIERCRELQQRSCADLASIFTRRPGT